MTLTEATGFGRFYKEPGTVSGIPALVTAEPFRAVAALSGGGFGAHPLRPFPAGWSAGVAVSLGFWAGGEHG